MVKGDEVGFAEISSQVPIQGRIEIVGFVAWILQDDGRGPGRLQCGAQTNSQSGQ